MDGGGWQGIEVVQGIGVVHGPGRPAGQDGGPLGGLSRYGQGGPDGFGHRNRLLGPPEEAEALAVAQGVQIGSALPVCLQLGPSR